MLKRCLIAGAFAIGGTFTLLILLVLRGFAQSQASMSAAPFSASGQSDSAIVYLIPGYFLVSAIGVLVSKGKPALYLWATLAHALLIVAYLVAFISAKRNNPDATKWPDEVIVLAAIMVAYFLPWLIGWGIVLLSEKQDRGTSLGKRP